MRRTGLTPEQQHLLQLHRDLDIAARPGDRPFYSGWATAHSAVYEHLRRADEISPASCVSSYRFMSDDDALTSSIRSFHERTDGSFPDRCGVFVGAGSSPLLSSTLTWLSLEGVETIHYLRPIYHAYYYLADALGLRMNGLLDENSSADQVEAALPPDGGVLLLTDPSWVFGRQVAHDVIDAVASWQERTGALVIVDGTFSYLAWTSMQSERSACLDQSRTIRLVCPTKSLCVHGARFAYLIMPSELVEEIGWIYCKMVASTSSFDIEVAKLMMEQLRSDENNRPLVEVLRHNHRALIDRGILPDSAADPECTYYVFGKTALDLSGALFMTGVYFELDQPADWIRVNLLSPFLPIT